VTAPASVDPFSPGFTADWEQACRDDAELNHLGGRANVRFVVEAGGVATTLSFTDGKPGSIRVGAHAGDFTLRAPVDVWARFLQATCSR
jgi:hypothetical protein